jgi:hypothetical protein
VKVIWTPEAQKTAFGNLFATDAEFVNVAGVAWTGRQSIQAQHAYSHRVIPADSPEVTEADRPYYGIFKTGIFEWWLQNGDLQKSPT